MTSDGYEKSTRLGYIIFGATTAIVITVISVVIFLSIQDSNRSTEAIVTACVSNGGSWILDGTDGECWQKDLMFQDGSYRAP
jgi:hypothetical protein